MRGSLPKEVLKVHGYGILFTISNTKLRATRKMAVGQIVFTIPLVYTPKPMKATAILEECLSDPTTKNDS